MAHTDKQTDGRMDTRAARRADEQTVERITDWICLLCHDLPLLCAAVILACLSCP